MASISTGKGESHLINREKIYSEVNDLYGSTNIVGEFPFSTTFIGEQALNDAGGVTRDVFSAFWEETYKKTFDGSKLLAPMMDADVESKDLSLLGAILSHGYLVSGFLPLRVAFPSLAGILIGPSCNMPPGLLAEAYVDSI